MSLVSVVENPDGTLSITASPDSWSAFRALHRTAQSLPTCMSDLISSRVSGPVALGGQALCEFADATLGPVTFEKGRADREDCLREVLEELAEDGIHVQPLMPLMP